MLDSSWSLLHDAALQTLQYSSVCQDWRPPECTILILKHWETKITGKPWWRRCCKMCFLSALQYDWRAPGRTASHHWRSESFQTAEPEHLKGRENWIFPQTVPTYCLSGRSCSRKKLHEVWPGLWGPAHSGRSLNLPGHTIQSQSGANFNQSLYRTEIYSFKILYREIYHLWNLISGGGLDSTPLYKYLFDIYMK